MEMILTFIAISIVLSAFSRFASGKPLLQSVAVIAALAILWYSFYYNTPENRAYRAFNHSVEKLQTNMQKTFQPERKREPEGWEAVKIGVAEGYDKFLKSMGWR